MTPMTADQSSDSQLRSALERLARKWTLTLPGGNPNRYHFFGEELTALLNNTEDPYLDTAAETLADNWANAGTGVPEGHSRDRAYFAFDVKQAVKASRGE
ncbi:hypothetical protein Achl_3958 (plasmid) [Pseudarthrobacter chlorophenolicus A6]|uniref:Uncharacterized protein n=2 Tax=Pseudarthrobacter chlorophenolicus TaxID=85085 RepID=B8HHL2_PSECP|nr:hypothetical protein Achl_3958 [Pseudarthrobacter chlorophenolicus A6]